MHCSTGSCLYRLYFALRFGKSVLNLCVNGSDGRCVFATSLRKFEMQVFEGLHRPARLSVQTWVKPVKSWSLGRCAIQHGKSCVQCPSLVFGPF